MKILYISILFIISFFTYAERSVEGKVLDAQTKEPLIGATISVPGKAIGTTTDLNGRFTLTIPSDADSLAISYVGFATKTVKVNGATLVIELYSSPLDFREIIITASREQQKRSEAPVAISKISSKLIENTKPTLLTEIVNKVPGAYMMNLNNEQHAMSIRQPLGYNAYFLYMEDGIPLRPAGVFNHNALIEMNMMGMSSIEVVKGPSSSLYGSEAIGGAINFITLAPTSVPTAKVGIQFDNYGYKRIQFQSGFYVNKNLGFSVGGYYGKQVNGWQTYSDYNKFSLNLRSDYSLNENTKIILAATTNDYYSQTGGSSDSIGFYSRNYSTLNEFSYREVSATRARITLQKNWSDLNESSLTLFYRNNSIGQLPHYSIRRIKNDPAKANGEINDNSFNSYGVVAQNSKRFNFLNAKLITGVSVDYSPNTYNAYYIAVDRNPDSGFYTSYVPKPDSLLTDYKADLINSALYMQFELSPVENLNVVLGLRYDRLDYKYDNHLSPSAYSGAPNETNGFNNLTPKVGLIYKVNNDLGMYANYSRGFSPPGINQLYRGVKVPELQPAFFDNYEIGGWFSLNNNLSIDMSIYQMNGFNEIVSYTLPDNSTESRNSGKTLHRGIEYGINFNPLKDLSFRFGGTNALHQFIKYEISSEIDYNGKAMPNAPEWIANGEVTYTPSFVKNLRLTIEYQRLSSYYKDPENQHKYEDKTLFGLKGISVLNIRAGYKFKGFEFYTNILNATNELYANMVTSSTYGDQFIPGAPRVFTCGLNYSFSGKK
ncbi:MAG TPA: TonB-dependent receptor [Cytophagales bacterium]|nr:TonB-dependent receptor [Cytophagales bacterium]